MPTVTKSSLNLSVKNATEFEKSINQEERVLSFFLGGVEDTTIPANAQINLNNTYSQASFFKRIDKSDVAVVGVKTIWDNSVFSVWNPYVSDLNNFYVVHNKNVYLVIGNNEQNDSTLSEKFTASSPPTHTNNDIVKYGDGYEYLHLYALPAQSKLIDLGNLWISVPNETFSNYKGSLLYKSINTSLLNDITISASNPEIEILSDSGSGAKIKLQTVVLSSPTRTLSERKYKVVGIDVTTIGNGYQDFDLKSSLEAVLTEETSSTITTLVSSISLGFVPDNGLQLRETLQANYVLLSLIVNSTDISSITDQTEFFSFGIVEGVTTKSDSSIFTKDTTTDIVTNNLKLIAGPTGPGLSVASATTLSPKKTVSLSSKTTRENAKIASSTQSGSDVILEVQLNNKGNFEVGDKIKLSDNDTQEYEITSVIQPDIKNFSGNTLHTGKTSFSSNSDSTKTFLAQVVQKF